MVQQYRKMDKLQIARTNKYNVYRCLIRKGPINRAAIAKLTDLSIPTVMSIIDDLLQKGIIKSIGKGESSGGKPPEMLEIVPERFYYIGVDIGRTTVRIVAKDAVFKQVACLQEPTGDPIPEKRFVDRLGALIVQLFDQLDTGRERILGVGVAMPGIIERETGNVLFSPDFEWNDIPLQTWLQKNIPFPVTVENANRALALNESYFSGRAEPKNPLARGSLWGSAEDTGGEEHSHITFAVNLGYGIGAALVMGEDLYSGVSGASGEIGHITVDRKGPRCHCGNSGCLEALASGAAIAAQAQAVLFPDPRSLVARLCGGDPSRIDAQMVFQAAEQGDKQALKIIDQAAEYIGIGVAMAINVLDPDQVILCGGLMKNGPMFFNKISAGIHKHKMRQTGRHLTVSAGAGGEYSTANGACRVLANNLWWQRALPF
jgi:predicted NBD/HSP70 family sugar kinase